MTHRSSASILYVDDDDELAICVEGLLRRAGHRVDTARNALEALRCLRARRYDLLMTDQWMPGDTGSTLIRQAREQHLLGDAATCIVSSDLDACRSTTVPILAKPITEDALLEHVGRMLGQRSAAHRRRRFVSVRRWGSTLAFAAAIAMASFVAVRASMRGELGDAPLLARA